MTDEPTFARLVSLACHDLRTPLATVNGFARTLERTVQLDQPADRYVEMIVAAAAQLAELLDELSLVARIEAGRYDPHLQAADSLQIAQGCVERLGADRVTVVGRGADVLVDIQPTERGVSALVQALLRHGGLDEVQVQVQGADLGVAPVTESSAKVVLGQDLRDLGAACAVRLIDRLGGEVAVEGSVLRIRLPQP